MHSDERNNGIYLVFNGIGLLGKRKLKGDSKGFCLFLVSASVNISKNSLG